MDIFVKHLDSIKAIAENIASLHGNRFEVDELVDIAYVGYDRAITNNPSLMELFSNKVGSLMFRVKSDMKDYIREQTSFRRKNRVDFISSSFQTRLEDTGDRNTEPFLEPSCTEKTYEEKENIDLLEAIFNKVELTDDEWYIIQSYFYEEKTQKDIAEVLNCSNSNVCLKTKQILNKLSSCAHQHNMI